MIILIGGPYYFIWRETYSLLNIPWVKKTPQFCSPLFYWSFIRQYLQNSNTARKTNFTTVWRDRTPELRILWMVLFCLYGEFFWSLNMYMLKRKKKPSQIFPDGSWSLPITRSIFCFLPCILAGILKREKEQEQLKAFGAVQFFQMPSICPFIISRYFCDLPYISRHRESMNSANIRVNLWVRNTSFIWKQEEDDSWTQIGRFPLESMDVCQYMPCFSSAKSLLLKLLMILFQQT